MKYTPTSASGYTLPPGICEISDLKLMLSCLLPDDVQVNIAIEYIRLLSSLAPNKTIRYNEKSFFYTNLAFTKSILGHLSDIEGFVLMNSGSYKSDKPINITEIDKVHSKCDCINGSILNGLRQHILFSFALDKPPGYKVYKIPRIKLPKKMKKSSLSHITFCLEDEDHKVVEFNGETVSLTCQLT